MILNLAQEAAALSVLRLVSRQFNQLVLPIIYHQVTLTARVVACFRTSTYQLSPTELQVVKDTCKHTRHITVDKELHWPSVLQLLHSLDELRGLRYVSMSKIRDPANLWSPPSWPIRHESNVLTHLCLVSRTGLYAQTPKPLSTTLCFLLRCSAKGGQD